MPEPRNSRRPQNDRDQRPGAQRPKGSSGQDEPRKQGDKSPPPRVPRGAFGWIVIFMLVGLLAVWLTQQNAGVERLASWNEFRVLYNDNLIVQNSVEVQTSTITARKLGVGGAEVPVRLDIGSQGREFWLAQVDELTNGDFRNAPDAPLFFRILFSPLTLTILIILLFWFVILRGLRGMSGGGGMLGSFGKSRHRVFMKENVKVAFKDVAGIEEAKQEVSEIVDFLKNPKKFTRLGARVPRGVLLVGEPGCGKTLLAKAIAGEADVPFFSISGSDFVEMFVGVGASRVRDLFKQAKESSPCIIFLDEIDAVGRRRGGGFTTGGHDEREQTLNAILVEMDGFDTGDQIIVVAATNRVDVLDPALLRPGRFDRQVMVPMPDLKGRLEILGVHAKKVKLGTDVDLERVARATPMFSGADLAALINEAAISAALGGKDFVEQDDLEEARDKVKYGRSGRSRTVEEDERIATAYHEAGHAILQAVVPGADPLHKVTIIPRGQAMGATFSLPEKDRHGYGLKWLTATMRVVCGGRIAELRQTGDMSSGAAMDISQLTRMARAAVLEWGMSDKLGFVRYAGEDSREMFKADREYSEDTARLIDEEVKRFADEAYSDAAEVLDKHWDAVERVAQALLTHETLTAEEVRKLLRGEALNKPTVSDLLALEAAKARAEQSKPAPKPRSDEGRDPGPGLMPSPA
ncbi:MAG: ATP-dependent zinc metalloprotease FtsH [Phycisphaeraceae bacterium]|nr:ATP-dependent zinc metalloprotease FtsH [Phycisphaeraceae bacterium]